MGQCSWVSLGMKRGFFKCLGGSAVWSGLWIVIEWLGEAK